ncbi:MAG: hypothetical protein IRZ28_08500, partial [Steroidobacteraceae bacterium]|nr:hypothetical protein [Steroidobacteraceae bacterium]
MASIRTTFCRTAALAALMLSMLAAPVGHAAITSGTSQLVTWTCTGMDCPWGSSLSGPALVWPETAPATSARFGYTTSQPVYLPGPAANGAIIWIDSGSAAVFAGTPNGSSHRLLATLNVGDFYEVSGLAANEVLSVQGEAAFSYQIDLPPLPGDPDDPEDPPPSDQVSKLVTWSCTGSPCPWGSSLTGHALAWPAEANPINMRFGYTTSDGIYLPASRANGAVIWIDEGSATVFAGAPGASSHRVLATIDVGEFYEVSGLEPNEVLSVQSDYPFTYQFDLPPPPEPGEEPQAPPVGTPSELVTWMCHSSSCPWGTSLTGHALVWPSDAQASNLRLTYTASRPIYLDANRANGTKIAVISGSAALFAGLPGAESHRLIATLSAGEEYEVAGIGHGEVLSVQSDYPFTYQFDLPPPPEPGEEPQAPPVGTPSEL